MRLQIDSILRHAVARFTERIDDQDRVEKRIRNWVRWLNEHWGNVQAHGQCGSAERLYRPEKLTQAEWEAREAMLAREAGQPINVTDAERVHSALAQLPSHISDFIRARYYRVDPPWKICRAFDLAFLEIEERRMVALVLLSRRLSLLDMKAAARVRRSETPLTSGSNTALQSAPK